jgi:hypothetical protein
VTDWIQAVAVVVALLVAAYQTRLLLVDSRKRESAARVARALDMYRDLIVDGDTAVAFHRVSVRLRHEGWKRHAVATWRLPEKGDLGPEGLMDPTDNSPESLFADFYRIIWYFERANLAITNSLIDREVFFKAAGFHVWWWNEIMRNVDGPKAMAGLRALASEVESWAHSEGVLADWESRCTMDFNGGPAASTRRWS